MYRVGFFKSHNSDNPGSVGKISGEDIYGSITITEHEVETRVLMEVINKLRTQSTEAIIVSRNDDADTYVKISTLNTDVNFALHFNDVPESFGIFVGGWKPLTYRNMAYSMSKLIPGSTVRVVPEEDWCGNILNEGQNGNFVLNPFNLEKTWDRYALDRKIEETADAILTILDAFDTMQL